MATPENRIPESEPHTLADYWTLILLAGVGICVWLAIDAKADDTATMLGLNQRRASILGAGICFVSFLVFGLRNKSYFGRWFTDKTRT